MCPFRKTFTNLGNFLVYTLSRHLEMEMDTDPGGGVNRAWVGGGVVGQEWVAGCNMVL